MNNVKERRKVDFNIIWVGDNDEPRFNCIPKNNKNDKNEYEEYPMARELQLIISANNYWDGVFIEGKNALIDAFDVLAQIQDFDHCACLEGVLDMKIKNH